MWIYSQISILSKIGLSNILFIYFIMVELSGKKSLRSMRRLWVVSRWMPWKKFDSIWCVGKLITSRSILVIISIIRPVMGDIYLIPLGPIECVLFSLSGCTLVWSWNCTCSICTHTMKVFFFLNGHPLSPPIMLSIEPRTFRSPFLDPNLPKHQ